MKKLFSVIITAILILGCFSGCGSKIQVTDLNVAELFEPSLKASVYSFGSYFYKIEKDSNKTPLQYETKNKDYPVAFKIVSDTTRTDILNKLSKYTTDAEAILRDAVFEEDGALYVADITKGGNADQSFYDIKSITLESSNDDGYYVTVDEYLYSGNGIDLFTYTRTLTYFTKMKDGILQIQGEPEAKFSNPINDSQDRQLIAPFDEFYDIVYRRN